MRRQRLAWAEKGWSTRTRRRPSFSSRGHGRGERETEDEEGECGEEGAGPGLKHGKVAARARQVAASAAQASHVARTASKVTTLLRNFKIPILPQTYH